MDPTQRKLMLAMPLLFVLFVIRFPAGVLVYWITTNTWTMGQQYIIKRRIGPVQAAPASGADTSKTNIVSRTVKPPTAKKDDDGGTSSNGSGSGGLSGLIRGRAGKNAAAKEKTPVATAPSGPPPRPPRKKKKRSGRRR